MYADFFTKTLQGATFRRSRFMIQGIPEIIPDVDMICPKAMVKFTSQEFAGQNDRQTHGTANASTDARGGTCMDARGRTYTYK